MSIQHLVYVFSYSIIFELLLLIDQKCHLDEMNENKIFYLRTAISTNQMIRTKFKKIKTFVWDISTNFQALENFLLSLTILVLVCTYRSLSASASHGVRTSALECLEVLKIHHCFCSVMKSLIITSFCCWVAEKSPDFACVVNKIVLYIFVKILCRFKETGWFYELKSLPIKMNSPENE